MSSCSRRRCGPGSGADLVDPRLPSGTVDVERLCLPSTTIQSEHELAGEALTLRMGGEQRLQLTDEFLAPAGGEVRVDAQLDRGQALLLQARDLCLREGLEGEVGQRPARQRHKALRTVAAAASA